MKSDDLKPNKEQMLAHVQHLFGDCTKDGLIELAWTGPRGEDRDVRHCEMFDITELDELVDRAFLINSFHGQNVYIGAAVRKPDTKKGVRSNDADALLLPALYVDLDDEGVAEAAIEKIKNIKPTLIVTTGHVPNLRQQLWWKLDEAVTDFSKSISQIKAITAILNGDVTIYNPSRVMRLAGSIAYPKKPGRIAEKTSLEQVHQYPFAFEAFAHVFPIVFEQRLPETPSQKISPTLNLPDAAGVRVEDCLRDLHSPGGWHKNVLRLTAHWVRAGLSDTEILLFSSALTLPHYAVQQTYRELQTMIRGAREKWAIPDPMNTVPDGWENTPLIATFLDDLPVAMIPKRQWILGTSLLIDYLSVLIAPPGVGKSTLCIAQAVAIITGKEITGQAVHRTGKVWIYNNEDESDELKRRLAAVLQHHKIDFSEIKGRLALNSGADRPLLVAKMMPDGTIIRTPDVDACIEHIKKNGISVFVADPFVETHELEENSNQQIKLVSQMFRDIARRAGCSVLLIHHTAKPPKGSSEGYAGDMNTARGASSLNGVARIMETLYGMSKKDSERYGIPANDRHLYVRLDDAKANLSLVSPDAKWFKRISVVIANGEEVGTLERVMLEDNLIRSAPDQDDTHHTIIASLAAQVKEDSLSLNAAAIRLAWGGADYFIQFRQTDAKGHQRASKTLRTMIEMACRANKTIVTGTEAISFVIDSTVRPVVIKRISRLASPSDLASQPPDFPDTEPMEEDYDF
ncbi:MAG: AAA family ATPase [Bdellovibrionales bacterium]